MREKQKKTLLRRRHYFSDIIWEKVYTTEQNPFSGAKIIVDKVHKTMRRFDSAACAGVWRSLPYLLFRFSSSAGWSPEFVWVIRGVFGKDFFNVKCYYYNFSLMLLAFATKTHRITTWENVLSICKNIFL